MKKRKLWLKAVTMFLLLFFGSASWAATYSANAGITAAAGLINQDRSAAASGNLVEYLYLKTGVIYGPINTDGAVNSTYEEVRPAVYPGSNDRQVGYDSTLANSIIPEPQDGKFWHQTNVDATAPQIFIVRAWQGATPGTSTYFGESVWFRSQDNPAMPPSNTELAGFQTLFPKVAPVAPAPVTSTDIQGSGRTPPRLQLGFNPVLGARNFEVQLSRDNFATPPFVDDTNFYKEAYHPLYKGDEAAFTREYTLTLADQLQTIYYRVRARNSFGDSPWTVGSQLIRENRDPSIPVAVTDLAANYDPTTSTINLRWTPPYDTNRSGDVAPCASYDLRVSREALTSTPQAPFDSAQTNPEPKDSWIGSTLLTAAGMADLGMTPLTAFPAPTVYGPMNRDTASITGTMLNGTYFFALKARDGSGNESYISNVAGVATQMGSDEVITYVLNATTGGMGVTSVSFPFTPPFSMHDATTGLPADPSPWVYSFEDLVRNINALAAASVNAIGYWDGTAKGIKKITYPGPVYTPAGSETTLVEKGRSYQIWVDPARTVRFIARGRR